MGYSRPQLKLLLLLAAILLVGLGVREWRADFPDAAERLERFDHEDPPPPIPPAPRPRAAARWSPARLEAASASRAPQPPRARVTPPPEPAAIDPRPLDINHATVEQIARLPGVGPSLARRIVDERDRLGRFDSPEGLRGILGLGRKKLAALREYVTVGE
ncbi:MAG TPA: helix-hairpin-helix domain-containing protein [Methylomirabilota bacterium]